ncbi:hypothetical protein NEMBOFW57_008956 [Staphylotrichum longicolle]|uniref:Uncharacterized protein n=1 Tax=Staphylotrichum longicolle TaxID=669026 RepID=A0AAD4ESP4_9PEZI|nr:hypothetical protein NEMBOFW57_008956 [Staphylotrichum longicolle]
MTTKKTIAIHVEPSPLESPGQAIREIQAQLKKLDSLEQATPQSASRRIALLEDLEREMGQQAEHWEEIKHDMIRDSLSSMQTTSPAVQDSRHASVASTINMIRDSTLRQSIGSERRASRVARMRGNVNPKVPEASVRNSGSPQLSKWQKRLTEAQMDYMDAQLLRTSNVNFLQLSRAQLASPTPPDSDDSEDEVPSLPKLEEVKVEKLPEIDRKCPSLWVPKSTVSAVPKGLLWTPVLKPVLEAEPALPGLSVRPAQRKEAAPLQIESSQLWRKPYNTANRSMSGLWRPLWASAAPPAEPVVRASPKTASTSQKPPRPVTQRPARRNKRVTLLPDILESPEPLPDKRGTLGIFQFPWGEKSDTASIQPRPSMYMAMPGTMTSGGPSLGMAMDARSKQLEPTEYSSSFFDDYDDEDDGNDETDSDEDESDDDGFDDSTLWEIASLLKTDAVPSRDSLLPPASGSVVYDYIDELASDEDAQEQSIVIGLAEPRDLFVEQQRDSATIESSTLLMLEEALESSPPAAKPAVRGLPANPKASLKTQASGAANSPAEATPAPAMSRTLQQTAEVQRAETAQEQGSSGLWTPPSKADKPSAHRGLFVAESSRAGFRGTSEEPAAKHMTRTPRPVVQKPLDRLTSTSLWVPEDPKQSQRSWILGASTVKHQGLKPQRIQASAQEWKAALNEAIAASYPRIKRINASPAEWKAALEEAIALSARAPPAQAPFNPAVQHPVFAARSLVTRSEWFHPAATGYTYDVAAVHPVFFGSLAITCPEDAVHPAISAYAAKKLRRQRSKQRSDSSSRTRSTSRSRRKDDIRAQIRALEQQDGADDDDRGLVYTSSAAPPPIPAAVFQSDSIQAQIEALEQERLFVERAAQEEYRRRTTTTITTTTTAMAVPEPVLVVETMPAGAETVQDLQRRMSMQIRQSLVFSAPAVATTIKPKSKPSVTVSTVEISAPVSVTPISNPATPQPEPHLSPLLWTPSPRPAPVPSPTPGLWSPVSRPPPAPSPWAEEDADAAAQRARRRRTVQKKMRRQEILAQIAAVERGANPFVDFAGMGLWAGKKGVVVGGVLVGGW